MTVDRQGEGAGKAGAMPVEALAALLERIAEELAFVTAGTNDGLLPLNALLIDLEQLPGLPVDSAPAEAISIARRWVDAILDGDGTFSAAAIQNLHAWHDWFLDHLVARETGRPAVAVPVQWRVSAAAVAAAAPPPVSVAASSVAHSPSPSTGDMPSFALRLPADLELLREFHSESLELLRSIEQSVLELEAGSAGPVVVNSIFRAFHTFKGSAGFLQLEALRDFAHQLESLLDEVRAGRLPVGPAVIAAILGGADVLAGCVAEVGEQISGAKAPQPIEMAVAPVLALVRQALTGEAPAVVPVTIPVSSPPSLPSGAPAPVPVSTTASAPAPAAVDRAEAFVRVDAGKLDALVNLVGELVITQAFVLENRELRGADNLELGYAIRKLQRITRDLQHNALSMRMVPISGLFRKMSRLVRDLAGTLGKQARLVVVGEETELDRHLVEQMGDPLVHMIRNALDHGVETPEVRIAAGKDPVATVRLAAAHAHGGVLIEVADDGRGIDAAAVRARAVDKQLINPDRELTREETLALIFLPGFTTAAAVTEVSGRGVGMDVVKGHIEALRGHVDIATNVGAGTTFSIRLPLTLSQIDGFLIRVGGERYILSAAVVRECFRPGPQSIATVHERGEMVDVRGRQIPLLRLAESLSMRGAASRPDTGIIVLLDTGVGERALLVDEVLGKQEVIIKNLGETFVGQALVAGGAILSDGRVALILDAEALARQAVNSVSRSRMGVA
jgi:two-component system chemotaxis sensor kinase CheA